MRAVVFILALFAASAIAEVYFSDDFSDGEGWKSRWVVSDNKKSEGTAGTWDVTNGEFFAEADKDKGLRTTQDARFYAISAKTDKEFSTEGKTLVVQYAVKHPQNIDCGGGYIKLLPAGLNQATFNGDSPYSIMFGPDICGTATRRIHVIFNHPEKGNLLVKKDIRCESDRVNHVYTLIVNGADRTYEVKVDGVRRDGGKLEDDWEFTAPRKIKDPSQSKPADWVDDAMMDDPSDVKPADWDSIPKQINDPEAVKPADWDDDADGTWEAPKIDNPAWKGEWKPKRIANPAYKGPWEHPMIDNPDYKEDTSIGQYKNLNYVGFELWQVKAGSIFSNILITDDVTKAEEAAKEIVNRSAAEKKALDDIEAAKREKEEAAKKEAEAAAAAAAPAKEAVDEDEKPKPKDSKDEL